MKYNIGLSSMTVWLYLEGEEKPVKGFSDVNCNICDVESEKTEHGETSSAKKIDLSKLKEVKIRSDWDKFSDEKFYGKIKIKVLGENGKQAK